ncbi:hypothetical protein RJ639_043686 [Escallonia herrerae]|uniref:Transposase (putative) gypsy type domain-containing protein n=1 Tax=Escallonia herrerae TaxID=1293975 RepID=A0AA89B1U5_9ASTE|nr:hypothetical protein RJ639_043686 [Escallonia herrerae]
MAYAVKEVPLHPFFRKMRNMYDLAPGQLSPHAWQFMSFFIYQRHKLGVEPRARFVKLPENIRWDIPNEWNLECDTRSCNTLMEKNLTEVDLEHIEWLKGAKPLESKYPLSNA